MIAAASFSFEFISYSSLSKLSKVINTLKDQTFMSLNPMHLQGPLLQDLWYVQRYFQLSTIYK